MNETLKAVFTEFKDKQLVDSGIVSKYFELTGGKFHFAHLISDKSFNTLVKKIDNTSVKSSTGEGSDRLSEILDKEACRLFTLFGYIDMVIVIDQIAQGAYSVSTDKLKVSEREGHADTIRNRLNETPYLIPFVLAELVTLK